MIRARSFSGVDRRIPQNLYLAAYLLFIIKYMCEASVIIPWQGIVDTIIIILFMCLLAAKLALQSYTPAQLAGFTAAAVLCVYSSINAKFSSPMLSFFFLITLQDVDLRRVLRAGYRLKAAFIIAHVVCYIALMVISPGSITYLYRGSVERHQFLFSHPNMFTAYVVWTCIEFIYVNYGRIRAVHLAPILLVNILFYIFTNSRTGLYIIIIITVLIAIEKSSARFSDAVLRPASRYVFGVCSALCYALTVVYSPVISGTAKDLWLKLNNLLTGRLVYGAYSYHYFGFTWLGRILHTPAKVYYNGHWLDGVILDNSYQWLMLVYGGVFLLLVSAAFFFAVRRMDNIERILVIAYAIYALMENYTVNAAICFPLLLIGKSIFARRLPDSGLSEEQEAHDGGGIPLWKRKSA